MRWLPAALLGGVMMTSGVLGHASDMFHQTLPLRGTAEASMARVSTILTTLGADPPGKYMERYIQGIFPKTHAGVLVGQQLPTDSWLSLTCVTNGEAPTAQELCQEIEKHYLDVRE